LMEGKVIQYDFSFLYRFKIFKFFLKYNVFFFFSLRIAYTAKGLQ